VARGTQKKPLDFGGNPHHATLELGWGVTILCMGGCVTGIPLIVPISLY